MRDIAAVMITCDRSPQKNYLRETIDNLARSDWFASGRILGTALCDSGVGFAASELAGYRSYRRSCGLARHYYVSACEKTGGRRCANENVADALVEGSHWRNDAKFVLFLEDDIDVCADFFDSVGAWLDDHAREDRRIYSFGANYPQVQELYDQGIYAWDYPIGQFYGTQAFAIRPGDALSLAEYIREHCYDRSPDGTQWDLLMQDWSREKYPKIDHFLASCPAMIQHIGEESVVVPGRKGHRYPSWPGREWSYLKERER